MSNYSIQASPGWDARDGLTTGESGKTISATEFHTEFTEIATVIATKANIASPELTGTPKATTASSGTNTDQIATTQYVQTEITGHATKIDIMKAVYPLGSIFTTVSDATDLATTAAEVATLMGFGTWVSFGAGKVLIGIDTSGTPDTDFDTVEETGGAKTHVLTKAELPEHEHDINLRIGPSSTLVDASLAVNHTGNNNNQVDHETSGSTISSLTSPALDSESENVLAGDAHNNLQPYIVVYMWKRTA